MLGKKEIDLELSPEVKEWVDNYMATTDLVDPIPGIIFGRWSDEKEDSWTIGLYEKSDLPKIDMWLCSASGLEFLTYDHLVGLLDGKTVHFQGGKLSIL